MSDRRKPGGSEVPPQGHSGGSMLERLRGLFAPAPATGAGRRSRRITVRKDMQIRTPPPGDHEEALRARIGELRAALERRKRRGRDGRTLLDGVQKLLDASSLVPRLRGAARDVFRLTIEAVPPPARRVAFARGDPDLSQALVRLANSTFYRTEVPVTSLEQAVLRVGEGGFRSVLLVRALPEIVGRPAPEFAAAAESIWAHMRRTATLARRLAPGFQCDAEQAYLAGLAHDVGKVILLGAICGIGLRDPAAAHPAQEAVEDLLVTLHEPLGGMAARAWGLGPEVADAIATHHRDPLPVVPAPLPEIVFLADRADRAVETGAPFDLTSIFVQNDLGGSLEMASRAIAEPWGEEEE